MKKKFTLYILMFLPLAAVLAALPFLPEQIPAHYGFDGQVTRWGSKYESLIFPAMAVLLGLIMIGLAKISAKQEENGSNNEKMCLTTGIAVLALFDAMTAYFLYTDFQAVDNLSSMALDVNQLMFGLLGISMIILGNIMQFHHRTAHAVEHEKRNHLEEKSALRRNLLHGRWAGRYRHVLFR